jgi:hypothetical protein
MRGSERHAQRGGSQQHHGLCPAARGEKLGVTGEGDARVVQDPLVDGAGHQGVEAAEEAPVASGGQGSDDIRAVTYVQPSGYDWRAQGDRQHPQCAPRGRLGCIAGVEVQKPQWQTQGAGTVQEHIRVCDRDQLHPLGLLGEPHDQIRSDTGRLPGGKRKPLYPRHGGRYRPGVGVSKRTST